MNKYNNNIGPETKTIEYKEFTFYSGGLNIDTNDAIDLIQTNKWIFNNHVINSIKNMINTYLPKYTCAYLSSNINDNGLLYFGVNDCGDLIGIPYKGYLDINKIKYYVKNTFKNNIKLDGNIMDYVDIDIIKLDYNDELSKSIHPNLLQYYKWLKIYNEKKEKYIANKQTWTKLTNRYNSKLCDLVNTPDTRHELIKYIENYNPRNPVIKLLKSNYKLTHSNMEIVNEHKSDINGIF